MKRFDNAIFSSMHVKHRNMGHLLEVIPGIECKELFDISLEPGDIFYCEQFDDDSWECTLCEALERGEQS